MRRTLAARWITQRATLCAALVLVAAPFAHAHESSLAFLTLDVDGGRVEGRWDVALRDLEDAVGLDTNGDRAVTWGEVEARRDAVLAYAQSKLALAADGEPCTTTLRQPAARQARRRHLPRARRDRRLRAGRRRLHRRLLAAVRRRRDPSRPARAVVGRTIDHGRAVARATVADRAARAALGLGRLRPLRRRRRHAHLARLRPPAVPVPAAARRRAASRAGHARARPRGTSCASSPRSRWRTRSRSVSRPTGSSKCRRAAWKP